MENVIDSDLSKLLTSKREVERLRQGKELEIENNWWGDKIITSENQALQVGILIDVGMDNPNYGLNSILRNKNEPRSLSPKAEGLLNKIAKNWKESVINGGLPSTVRIPVSSLFRTVESLAERVRLGIASANIGPHQAGMAFDIDPNSYYFGEESKAINRSDSEFNQKFIEILIATLKRMEKEGDCHVIFEKGYKIVDSQVIEYDSCYHICVNPNFDF